MVRAAARHRQQRQRRAVAQVGAECGEGSAFGGEQACDGGRRFGRLGEHA
jgi:hypothetical protein